jgi:hypothetical protein
MKPYNVITVDHTPIIKYVESIRSSRMQALNAKYPEYEINIRNRHEHEPDNVIPFFDIVCESLLHKDGNGFFEVPNFTYQMNCFAKSIFHRKAWWDFLGKTEPFLEFILKDYKEHEDFIKLEQVALTEFDRAFSLLEYYQNFAYNDDFRFVQEEDIRELFDELVKFGLFLGRHGDLYQVYTDVDLTTADTNIKYLYHSGRLSRIDKIHLQSKFDVVSMPVLSKINSKFNFIPKSDPDSLFSGLWSQVKFGNSVWFIPQFLLFYGNITN